MSRSDKWMWFFWWPISVGGLVGFGALGPGSHPWQGWGSALAGGVCVLVGIGMGMLLGLQFRCSVTDSLTKWAVDAQMLYDQEAESHEKTADVLFDLAYGVTSVAAAQAYLAELDRDEDEDDPTRETEH